MEENSDFNELNETISYLAERVKVLELSVDSLGSKLESNYSKMADLETVIKKLITSAEKLNETIWNKM